MTKAKPNSTVVLKSTYDKDKGFVTLKKKADYLYNMSKPFKIVKSGSRYELVSSMWNEKASRLGKGFTTDDLQFVRSVRNYIEKHDISEKFIDTVYQSEQIDYFKFNTKIKIGSVYEDNVYGIDITSAYWKAAHLLGIIDTKLYQKGMDKGKVVRLASLGSLAKKKTTWEFDGKEFKKLPDVLSPHSNLWFVVCKHVSDVMNRAAKALGSDFLFFWVDCVYFKADNEANKAKVLQVLTEAGFMCQMEYVEKLEVFNNRFEVWKPDATEETKKIYYCDMTGGKSKPISQYIENQKLFALADEIIYGKKKV